MLTPDRIKEVTDRARLDAKAFLSGWPVRSCPYSDVKSATLWSNELQQAIKAGKK